MSPHRPIGGYFPNKETKAQNSHTQQAELDLNLDLEDVEHLPSQPYAVSSLLMLSPGLVASVLLKSPICPASAGQWLSVNL